MNESRIQVTKTERISLLKSTFPEVKFGHECSNGVVVCEDVDVFPV